MTRDTRAKLDEPWSRERVLKAVKGRQSREIAEYGYLSRAAHMLVTRIKPAVAERDHPVFAISSAEHEKYRSVLRELIFKELLQPDVPAEYRRQATSELLAFAVCEELMREWHRAVSINQELQVILDGDSVEEPREPTLRELRIYLDSGRPE
jgi:alkylation response protein AidB-like acyl-CoA dehydrogenase